MTEGALVSYTLNKIESCIQEISRIWKVKVDVESLKDDLLALQSFLHSMDYKQRQDKGTKIWLSSVRDGVYEAEDLLDTYFLGQRYAPVTKAFNSYSVQKDIESLKSKIHTIFERRTLYVPNSHQQRGEGSSSGAAADQSPLHPRRRSSPHLGDDVVIGFEQDANFIVERLLHPERRRQVVAITGMGGAGKTTLAAVVYNSISESVDPRRELQNHFDVCAWVPIHQDPNIMKLLLILIDQLGLNQDTNYQRELDVQRFERMLYEFLKQRRYLIVLDDIWKKEVWGQLKGALPDSGNGSRIIVTTRSMDVAHYLDPSSEPYEMRPLDEDDSWRLFLTKVFPQLTPSWQREQEDLGLQLCRKCAGLPLALVLLGGLVSTKLKKPLEELELIDKMNWDSTEDGRLCLEIIGLSYYDLPYNIKFCFLYLGAFPQGSKIGASKLMKLWIGDDLIPREDGTTLEKIATKYMEELAQSCLVEIVKRGADMRIKKVRVHNLLGELAKSKARESRFLQVKNLSAIEEESRPQEIGARRMALHQSRNILKEIWDEKLRALLVFPTSETTQTSSNNRNRRFQKLIDYYKRVRNIRQTDKRMKLLRVFELGGFTQNNIPEFDNEHMTRLRYMVFKNTNIAKLTFSGGIPPHLQTLDIRGTIITKLPSKVWTLSKLRHLYLNSMRLLDSQELRNMEKTFSEAASTLQTLKIDDGCETPDTTDNQLVGYLKLLSSLNSLTLQAREITQEIFTATSTHAKLHKLKLDGRLQPDKLCGIECFAPHITELTLSRSKLKGEPTRTLGQLENLRILKLTDDAFQCSEISCSPGSFPNLSYLKLSNLSNLELLNIERGSFPNLMRLTFHDCTVLDMAPNGLSHITTLQVLKCKWMLFSFVKKINDLLRTHPVRVIIQNPLSAIMDPSFDAGEGPSVIQSGSGSE